MPDRELVFEDKIWQWKDSETGELAPLTQAEVLEQQELERIPAGGQAGADAATAAYLAWLAEQEKVTLSPEDRARWNRWKEGLPEGAIGVDATEVEIAKAYMKLGLSFAYNTPMLRTNDLYTFGPMNLRSDTNTSAIAS